MLVAEGRPLRADLPRRVGRELHALRGYPRAGADLGEAGEGRCRCGLEFADAAAQAVPRQEAEVRPWPVRRARPQLALIRGGNFR